MKNWINGVAAEEASEMVVLEPHRRAFTLDALPDDALFVIAEKDPVRHFGGGASAALADFVEERGADADAGAVGQVVKV
jgi:hypothetical protein